MTKISIITKREYFRRVNKKSFILITLFAPVLFAALVFVPLWLSSIKSNDVHEVAIIDHTGKYTALFNDTDNFKFVNINDAGDVNNAKKLHNGIFAFLEITDDLLNNPTAAILYSEKQIPMDLSDNVNRTISRYLENEKRASFNIPNIDEIINNSKIDFRIQTIKWGKDGQASESSSLIGSIIGIVFTFIIYMFIMMYGAMVMQGVMEEKTNRIIEVMVSSVRPFDLMMGKIIGIGLVGITQVLIWCVLTSVLVGAGSMLSGFDAVSNADMTGMSGTANVVVQSDTMDIFLKLKSYNFAEIIIYFILYFIGGYITYASLFAAVGAAIDNSEDSQQFMMPIMIFLMFGVYAGIYSAQNPDGPLAFWCSFIPFTSPIVMMVRIPYDVPFWQILLSLLLLFVSAVFFVWCCAKIYRVGILMYGKKPSIKELVKWIKYK